MSRITIYSKAGVPKYEASGLELHDTWMGESYVSFDINSPTPIDIQIGDYLIYRGEVFSAYNIPSVLKQARSMSYGNAFEYKGVKFSSAGMELTDIRFFDVVLNDNEVHYTTLPTFSFYCETVDDLLDRFQANTNRENVSQWYFISPSYDRTIQRYDEGSAEQQEAIRLWEESYGPDHTSPQCDVSKEKRGTSISVDKKSVWDSLAFILDDFGLHFICKGHAIIVGYSGVAADHIFRYGKGNGLASIERVADTNQQVVTKLYAYGSDKNLPSHYYAELNIRAYGYLAAYDQEKQYYLTNQSYVEAYFTTKNENDKYIGSIEYGEVIYDVVFDQDTFGNLIIYGVPYSEYLIDAGKFYFVTGVKKSRLPDREVIPGAIPNNMAVNMLMLPGFPTYSLSQLCRCEYVNGETIFYYKKTPTSQESEFLRVEGNHVYQFSEDEYRPFIVSNNAEQLGIKEGDIHFTEENDDNGLKAIYPSIEEMTVGDVFGNDSTERLDEIYACDVITDSGYFADGEEIPTFKITLKNLGFDLRQAFAAGGSDMTLSMKDGSCGGRDFKVTAVKQVQNGRWELTCERCYDNALELYFPYSYSAATGGEPSANEPYQIMAGDHFVLTEIEIEDTTYIQAASVKALRKAILWLVANDYTRFTYLPKVDEIYMARQDEQAQQTGSVSYHDTLRAGLLMLFEDSDLDVDGSVYIDSLTIKEYGNNGIPTYEVTLREEKQVGNMQRMQNQINSLSSTVNGSSGGSSVPQIKQLIKTYGTDQFLSKTNDDTAQGLIGFVKGLWVKTKGLFGFSEQGDVTARSLKATGSSGGTTPDTDNVTQKNLGLEVSESGVIGGILRVAQSLLTKTIQSLNFSGSDSLTGTGWQLTDDYGNGRSRLIVDDAVFRGKVTMNELEVRKLTAMGGNYVFSPAASIIEQVDYIGLDEHGEEIVLGYTRIKEPWVLRLIPLSLKGRYLSRYKLVRSTISEAALADVKFYRCWLKADDGSTQTINTWKEGMLARCQTFDTSQIENGTHDGTYSDADVYWGKNVTNKLYWRAVVAVADNVDKEHYEGQTIALDDGRKHNYIDIANYTDDDNVQLFLTGSDHVSAGDHIVCFGDWKDRQLANLVTIETIGDDAPAVKEFVGVGYTDGTSIGWNLDGKMRTRISPTAGNRFIAPEFIIETDGVFVKYDECVGFDTPSNPKDGDVMLLSYDDISSDYQVEVWDAATSTWNDEHEAVGKRYYCTTNGHVYEATATGWKDLGFQLGQSVSSLKVEMDGITAQVSDLDGNLSTLSQTADGLQSTVQSHTTQINNIDGRVTTNASSISTVQQQADSIQSAVSTIQGDYVTNSTLTQTANSIKTEVKGYTDESIAAIDLSDAYMKTIDATGLDEGKWFPVLIRFGLEKDAPIPTDNADGTYNGSEEIRCQVRRTLNSDYGVPSYAEHEQGFSLLLDWTTKAGGWGTNNVNEAWSGNDASRFIGNFELLHANNGEKVVGGIGQITEISAEVVYIRGGSKYDIITSHKPSTAALMSSGFTWSATIEGTTYTKSRQVITDGSTLVVPVRDTQTRSEISQTASSISATVQANIEGKLSATGIKINGNTREIDLIAGKVNFKMADGTTVNAMISINPDTGTLYATDVQVSGNVIATSGQFTGDIAGGGLLLKDKDDNDNDRVRVTIKPDTLGNMTVLQGILQAFLGFDGLMISDGSGKLAKFTDDGFEFRFPKRTFGNYGISQAIGLKFSNYGLQVPYRLSDGIPSSYVNYDGFQSGIKLLTDLSFVAAGRAYAGREYNESDVLSLYVIEDTDTFLVFDLNGGRDYYICLGDGAGASTNTENKLDGTGFPQVHPEVGRKITILNTSYDYGHGFPNIYVVGGGQIFLNTQYNNAEGRVTISRGQLYNFTYLGIDGPSYIDGSRVACWLADNVR